MRIYIYCSLTALAEVGRARACTWPRRSASELAAQLARPDPRARREGMLPRSSTNREDQLLVRTTRRTSTANSRSRIGDRNVNVCRDVLCQYSRLSAHYGILLGHCLPESWAPMLHQRPARSAGQRWRQASFPQRPLHACEAEVHLTPHVSTSTRAAVPARWLVLLQRELGETFAQSITRHVHRVS